MIRRTILPVAEIQRNNRIAELMKNKQVKTEQKPLKLTIQQMDEVNELRKEGVTREEAINMVLKKTR